MFERLSNDLLVRVVSWLDGGMDDDDRAPVLESAVDALSRVCWAWK